MQDILPCWQQFSELVRVESKYLSGFHPHDQSEGSKHTYSGDASLTS